MTTTRRQAREWAIQMLTAADLNPPADVESFMADYWAQADTLDAEDGIAPHAHGGLKAFAEERVRGVLADREELDRTLAGLLKDWDLYRLGTVERAVLRMGIWEMTRTDVPRPVCINEAIDLVNWFASPRSRTLVNGVLDRFAKSLPPPAAAGGAKSRPL